MKFFSSSLLALGLIGSSIFASAAVIPAEKREVAPVEIEKRVPDLAVAISIVQTLYDEVKGVTGTINATVAALPDAPSLIESATAATKINDAVGQITVLITGTIAKINSAAKTKRSDVIIARQAPTDLAGVLVNLLIEISSTLNGVINALGLGALLAGTLGGLVTALSGLLLALVPVVDNLLELVRRLLDGLLIGLSAALLGLII
ncbi:hypothetical protein ABW19_dt0206087 [Dactylella cylindrospora]|nr:hypothetical protein ABW19_dt0206087 [Dactylella cylindrospora]